MNIDLSKRGLLTMFFRRRNVFLVLFGIVVAYTAAYLALSTPLYSASGSLLVKFGANAVPAVSRSTDDNSRSSGPEEDHASALESNLELLKSRSLLRDVVNEFGVDTLYPGLTVSVAGEDTPVEAAVSRIIKKDLTAKVEQQSDIITLTYLNRSPELASKFLQRLMVAFIEQHAEFYKKPPTEFLAAQIKEASEKLDASQKAMREFKEKNGLSSLETELQELLRAKSDTQNEALRSIDEARIKLEDLKLKESDLLNTYRPDSKIITDLRHNISVAEAQLRDRQNDLKGSAIATGTGTGETPVTTGQIQALNRRIATIEAERGQYDDLQRQVQIDEDNYKSYVEHGEQARISASLNKDLMTSITVVDEPVVPQKPSQPKKMLIMLAGILAGLILAGWTVIVLEHFDDRLMNPEQVVEYLGIPVLASYVAPARIGSSFGSPRIGKA